MSLLKTLTEKPWERKGVIGGPDPEVAFESPPERVALGFFLTIASVIFSMFGVSYVIRMSLPDWTPLAEPSQLWLNTGLLVISSILFQWARNTANAGKQKNLIAAFIGGGVFALLFIAGQILTWESLQASGFYVASNPANSFFYLLTGLHIVHLLGGLWVWSKSSIRLLFGSKPEDVRLSIELCTIYWHFLLIVWLVIFAVLSNT
ncbi:MAG: cytochrome c oxidase subunit 3 [Gammaproteobacteria bacterium]|nr:cytochrome c oxidase subunit 3 [Gammaproteobacteria bacterium]